MSFKSPTDQMARWMEMMAQFNFKIEHRKGTKHVNCDSLSRIPCDPKECDCYDANSILENLPCKGCKTCIKHRNDWSEFEKVDDVIPLFTRNISASRINNGCTSFHLVKHFLYCWNLIVVFLATVIRNVKVGFHKVTGSVLRLRIRDNVSVCEQGVSLEGVEKGTSGLKYNNIDTTLNVGDQFKPSLLVNQSPGSMANLQRNDPDIGCVIIWLEKGRKPTRDVIAGESPIVRNLWLNWDILHLKNGVLFRKLTCKDKTIKEQLVIPSLLKKDVLKSCHNFKLSAHLGIDKTVFKVKSSFYWYKMKDDVKDFIRNCTVCASRKRPTKQGRHGLIEYSVSFPLDRVCTDVVGPLPVSQQGNRYILVVMDQFTKFVECYAIPNQKAEIVARKIVYEYFSRYGVSLDIHSDQGSNFQSKLFREVCRLLEINQTRTSSFHPSGNGMSERFNQCLYNMITTYIDENQSNWDEDLALVTSAYRSCVHSSTGYSPNYLMFGREVTLPIQLQYGCFPKSKELVNESEYAENLKSKLENIYSLARTCTKSTIKRQKRDYDSRINTNSYKIGDLVYCLDKSKTVGRSKKLEPVIWQGPLIITRKFSDLLFEIKSNVKKPKIVHHDRLKPYNSNIIPDWTHALKMKIGEEKAEPIKQQLASKHQNNKLRNTDKTKNSLIVNGSLRRSMRNRKQTEFYRA
jgi:hypothetical protein